LRFKGRCYRGHDPTWSFSPISGEGAAKTGGRFNREGEPILYLSLDVITAVGECTQGLTQRLQPLTMCEYDIDCDPIADLRTATHRTALGVELDDLACAWLDFLRAGKEAPSWRVVDKLKAAGNAGMLVPSFFPGAGSDNCNLILWRWGRDLPAQVSVFDPSGRLPKNQLSWG
jgi:RES domain-containing protein